MNRSDYNSKLKHIKSIIDMEIDGDEYCEIESLIEELFKSKNYDMISELYFSDFKDYISEGSYFEVAYSLSEKNYLDESEKLYLLLLDEDSNNPSVLNNLSNILKAKKKYNEAYLLISKAKELSPNDDIIVNNYNSLSKIMDDITYKNKYFEEALTKLCNENSFVRNKLSCFIKNIKLDKEYENGKLAIPNWKFKVLMQTDDAKSESLKRQWLNKGYIIDTGEKADNFVKIYEINPHIEEELKEIEFKKINELWINGIEKINLENLANIGYFEIKKKLNKINQKYRKILIRDFEELSLNYIFQNYKSIIILSGSFIETLLIYYCEKKKLQSISYSISNRTVTKKLYETDLNDLLQYFEINKTFSKQLVHLGNVSRLYRNFIHPGKEIREIEDLDQDKSDLCYLTVKEIIKEIV